MTEKQINQDPPVAKENVLLMEIEMKRNSQKPDTVGPTVLSRRVKKKIIVILCVWGRISRGLTYDHVLLNTFTEMIIHHLLHFEPCQLYHHLNLSSTLLENDFYLNCAHCQISRERGLRGYCEGGDENDNDFHYDDHDNDDDEMRLKLLRQKPELQLAAEVDRRATNRWKGRGGSQQPWINIVIVICHKYNL